MHSNEVQMGKRQLHWDIIGYVEIFLSKFATMLKLGCDDNPGKIAHNKQNQEIRKCTSRKNEKRMENDKGAFNTQQYFAIGLLVSRRGVV